MGIIGERIKMWWMSDEKEELYRNKRSKESKGCMMNIIAILVGFIYLAYVGEVESLYGYPGELAYSPLAILAIYFVHKKIKNKRKIRRLNRKMESIE